MKKFINLVEKYLIRCIVLGLVALVIVQGLMTKDSMRLYLSWGERMEGQNIKLPVSTDNTEKDQHTVRETNSPHAEITLSVNHFSSLPNSIIIVNGLEKARFTTKEITLELMAGDIIEIDSSYYNNPIEYKIAHISDNISYPEEQMVYTANKAIVMIGKIIVK